MIVSQRASRLLSFANNPRPHARCGRCYHHPLDHGHSWYPPSHHLPSLKSLTRARDETWDGKTRVGSSSRTGHYGRNDHCQGTRDIETRVSEEWNTDAPIVSLRRADRLRHRNDIVTHLKVSILHLLILTGLAEPSSRS
jgi:hypothetical protein